jgi:hypothetical protein
LLLLLLLLLGGIRAALLTERGRAGKTQDEDRGQKRDRSTDHLRDLLC